jgi:hypothetical protein
VQTGLLLTLRSWALLGEAHTAADMLAFSKFWYYVRSHAESVVLCPGKGSGHWLREFEYELGPGGLPFRGRGQVVLPELGEGFLDVAGGGC